MMHEKRLMLTRGVGLANIEPLEISTLEKLRTPENLRRIQKFDNQY